jgi:hypothetical protein
MGERKETYRKTRAETEVLVDGWPVEAFEVRERPVVGLVDEGCGVVNVF